MKLDGKGDKGDREGGGEEKGGLNQNSFYACRKFSSKRKNFMSWTISRPAHLNHDALGQTSE